MYLNSLLEGILCWWLHLPSNMSNKISTGENKQSTTTEDRRKTVFSIENFKLRATNWRIHVKLNILFKLLELHQRCKMSGYVTERLSSPEQITNLLGYRKTVAKSLRSNKFLNWVIRSHTGPRSKFTKTTKFHFIKWWKTNSTMWKNCQRGVNWMVTPKVFINRLKS